MANTEQRNDAVREARAEYLCDWLNSNAASGAAPFKPTPVEAGLRDAAQFILDQLSEFERELYDDEIGSEFYGHIVPAIFRLRAALSETLPGQEND